MQLTAPSVAHPTQKEKNMASQIVDLSDGDMQVIKTMESIIALIQSGSPIIQTNWNRRTNNRKEEPEAWGKDQKFSFHIEIITTECQRNNATMLLKEKSNV